jgi:ferredoxin
VVRRNRTPDASAVSGPFSASRPIDPHPMTSYTVDFVVPGECDLDRAGDTVTIEVDEDASLLDAARSAGLWLPADCQQGWCTTCAAELLAGDVDQSLARRYFDADEEAGLILTCVAKPRSDCRVRVCQQDRMLDNRAEHDLPPGRSKR